jgi:hypothetical protein
MTFFYLQAPATIAVLLSIVTTRGGRAAIRRPCSRTATRLPARSDAFLFTLAEFHSCALQWEGLTIR